MAFQKGQSGNPAGAKKGIKKADRDYKRIYEKRLR